MTKNKYDLVHRIVVGLAFLIAIVAGILRNNSMVNGIAFLIVSIVIGMAFIRGLIFNEIVVMKRGTGMKREGNEKMFMMLMYLYLIASIMIMAVSILMIIGWKIRE